MKFILILLFIGPAGHMTTIETQFINEKSCQVAQEHFYEKMKETHRVVGGCSKL